MWTAEPNTLKTWVFTQEGNMFDYCMIILPELLIKFHMFLDYLDVKFMQDLNTKLLFGNGCKNRSDGYL
jgi:hypothetical protein